MIKKTLSTLLLSFITLYSFAQTTEVEEDLREKHQEDTLKGWTFDGYSSIVFNQAYFNNWAAGGIQSIATTGILNANAFYKKKKNVWDNSLDMTFGTIQRGKGTEFVKSDDKIEFNSKYGRYAAKNWYYAALLNFKTQFTTGYDYTTDTSKISNFMAPGYLIVAVGMDYKPNNHFTAFATPISGRYTFVMDQDLANAGAYGVDSAHIENGVIVTEGANYRQEIGGYVRIATTFDIMENIGIDSKINLFSNYLENPQNIDIDWELMVSFKFNEFITANVKTQMIYDDDIPIPVDEDDDGIIDSNGPRLQFKEMFGIGITYKL